VEKSVENAAHMLLRLSKSTLRNPCAVMTYPYFLGVFRTVNHCSNPEPFMPENLKIRGISQQKLIKQLMDHATGKVRMTSEQVTSARALLDKVLPGAARTGDAQTPLAPDYREFRLIVVPSGHAAADGDKPAPAPAPAGRNSEPE
jgi:hypothetical protein